MTSQPARSNTVRFRIELIEHADTWEARIFDRLDHGDDIAYAGAEGSSLEAVLRHASHYVLVAS